MERMGREEIKEKVLDLLEELTGDDIIRTELDINLLDEDLIDSLDYTELLVSFEDAFDIVMAPSEYTREEMDTPQKIIDQVIAKVEG